jgi:hypothetical protein
MEPIQFVYLAVYFGFNIFFGVFFIIGIRMAVKAHKFKKRKKYFDVPAKATYVRRAKIRDRITGTEYRYVYKIKVKNTIVEGTIDSISNEKARMEYPMDNKWFHVTVNPEDHSEFRLDCEDNAIRYYRRGAIALLLYGGICRLIFEFAIWGSFLAEGGLR